MQKIEKFLEALSDKTRLRIIKLLEHKPMCVCELACILKATQPNISKHLKKLKNIGIIESKQDGFWTNYFLKKQDDKYNEKLITTLNKLLDDKTVIKNDFSKAKTINRKNICNTKGEKKK